MLLSGYLFYHSTVKHTFPQNIKSRIYSLLIPILIWNSVSFSISIIRTVPFSLSNMLGIYIRQLTGDLWFLWAVFYCSFVVIIVKQFFRDSLLIYFIGLALSFVIPDYLGSSMYKYMYPFFITGYFFNKNMNSYIKTISNKYIWQFVSLIVIGAAFSILLRFFNKTSYIYTTGFCIFGGSNPLTQLEIDLYRFLIGLVGSVFVITFVNIVFPKIPDLLSNGISFLGKNSLGIYILAGYISGSVLPLVQCNLGSIHYILNAVETFIITGFTLFISCCIKRIKLLDFLLLGGRK